MKHWVSWIVHCRLHDHRYVRFAKLVILVDPNPPKPVWITPAIAPALCKAGQADGQASQGFFADVLGARRHEAAAAPARLTKVSDSRGTNALSSGP